MGQSGLESVGDGFDIRGRLKTSHELNASSLRLKAKQAFDFSDDLKPFHQYSGLTKSGQGDEAADSTDSTEPIHLVLQHLRESFSLS